MSEPTVYIVFREKECAEAGIEQKSTIHQELVGVYEAELDAKYRIQQFPEGEQHHYEYEEHPVEVVAKPDA